MTSKYASYIRVSTDKQQGGEQSQRGSIQQWFQEHDVEEWDEYVDINKSGGTTQRKQFQELLEKVEDYDAIVMNEISRLARKTSVSADFIDKAVNNDTRIVLLDEMIDEISPSDEMSQFFAKQLALWYEEERKQTIRRIRRGIKQAQRQGKWTGQPPAGFETDDSGYLQVKPEEYIEIQEALRRIEEGESYRSVAETAPVSRPSLMNICDERKHWYLDVDEEIEDEKVESAVEQSSIERIEVESRDELEEVVREVVEEFEG